MGRATNSARLLDVEPLIEATQRWLVPTHARKPSANTAGSDGNTSRARSRTTDMLRIPTSDKGPPAAVAAAKNLGTRGSLRPGESLRRRRESLLHRRS